MELLAGDTSPYLATAYVGFFFFIIVILKKLWTPYRVTPNLYYAKSKFTDVLLQKCVKLSQPFCPPFWATNAHIQTVLPGIIPKPPIQFKREYLDLQDGGVLGLDWVVDSYSDDVDIRKCSTKPIIIVLPGLIGEAMSMANLCKTATLSGFIAVVFNKRGHGDSPLKSPWFQSFGDPTDFAFAVGYIQKSYPLARLAAVGSSAGSGLLVSYLGDYSSVSPLAAGVCISPGYDAEVLFSKPFLQPYDFVLLRRLKGLIKKHGKLLETVVDFERALQSKTLPEFEDKFYRALYGHKTMADHWKHNNPMRAISNIKTPILCISSLDDPICRKELIPVEIGKQENVLLVTTEKGGHCGFLEGPSLTHWADLVALEYITAVLNTSDD